MDAHMYNIVFYFDNSLILCIKSYSNNNIGTYNYISGITSYSYCILLLKLIKIKIILQCYYAQIILKIRSYKSYIV